ncbi:hypothetical protein SDRG_07919 [Saprolegnia diclina VS20]|uniref:Amidase domain-containing protein n=1 Tax=Saprolegnia diclina (strain VS20) TaxID=1156394 RepID=T0QLB5_SAPDV|nr:hypothetical protein SDRG_07919 [Saprolegnia diclina VS20]EQC34595.1 hypothetical protein SDRG_07919 [Saprolegnia diclina VS20]|eukprot:XP_008612001.1 hypothetical protein SDRG_07919 [Saprolegnia diclina VS20]
MGHRDDDHALATYDALVDKVASDSMNLTELRAPRLTGNSLKIFAKLLRAPVLGPAILRKIKSDNRMIQVRELAATLRLQPLYYPLSMPSSALLAQHSTRAHAYSLQALATMEQATPSLAFHRYTAADYVGKYTSGAITPLQAITAVLNAIDDSNRREMPLRAFIQVHTDAALEDARASTARYRAGAPLGPLDGVPIAVKDEIEVQGYMTTFGTSFLGSVNGVATVDCLPVARLRAAGAIIVGKTNMHEFGAGCFGINIHHGTARNPFNENHMTGGSSSGSAAAVAAGLVPIAIGCDGGGSVRIPAGLCGVVGLKATYMRIPYDFHGCPSLSNVGPLAGTVQDAALAYAVMAGSDAGHPMSVHQPPLYLSTSPVADDLGHLRVGIYPDYLVGTDAEIVTAFHAQVAHLQARGATIVHIKLPNLQAIHFGHNMTILTEMAQATDVHYRRIREFSADVQINLELARSALSSIDFLAAQRVRAYATNMLRDVFDAVDVLVTPTTSILAPRLEPDVFKAGLSQLELTTGLMKYMVLGNFVGVPGIAVPIGLSSGGLPMSLQLQAAHWHEDTIVQLARLFESLNPMPPPPVYYAPLDNTPTDAH